MTVKFSTPQADALITGLTNARETLTGQSNTLRSLETRELAQRDWETEDETGRPAWRLTMAGAERAGEIREDRADAVRKAALRAQRAAVAGVGPCVPVEAVESAPVEAPPVVVYVDMVRAGRGLVTFKSGTNEGGGVVCADGVWTAEDSDGATVGGAQRDKVSAVVLLARHYGVMGALRVVFEKEYGDGGKSSVDVAAVVSVVPVVEPFVLWGVEPGGVEPVRLEEGSEDACLVELAGYRFRGYLCAVMSQGEEPKSLRFVAGAVESGRSLPPFRR